MTKEKHAGETSITLWGPVAPAAAIDEYLRAKLAGATGHGPAGRHGSSVSCGALWLAGKWLPDATGTAAPACPAAPSPSAEPPTSSAPPTQTQTEPQTEPPPQEPVGDMLREMFRCYRAPGTSTFDGWI